MTVLYQSFHQRHLFNQQHRTSYGSSYNGAVETEYSIFCFPRRFITDTLESQIRQQQSAGSLHERRLIQKSWFYLFPCFFTPSRGHWGLRIMLIHFQWTFFFPFFHTGEWGTSVFHSSISTARMRYKTSIIQSQAQLKCAVIWRCCLLLSQTWQI